MLFRLVEPTTLRASVAAVVVEFYLHVGFYEFTGMRETELHIFYAQTTVYPLVLVVSVDAEDFTGAGIQTIGGV